MESIKEKSALSTIFWGGLIAGILDANAAVVVYWFFKDLNPFQVLQYVASGVFGPSTADGSLIYVVVGLIFHFVIAYTFAIFFFFIYPKIEYIKKNIIVAGLVYGLSIWFFMNAIILPNSNIPKSPMDFVSVIEALWHMVLVGLPIAIITDKYYQKKINRNSNEN